MLSSTQPDNSLSHDSQPRVSWLQNSGDVLAHLCFVAAEVGHVQLDVQGQSLPAILAFPNPAAGTVDAVFAQEILCLQPGSPVQVRYFHEGGCYSFLTVVQEEPEARRWRMAVPNAVCRRAGRGAVRTRVLGRPDFLLHVEQRDGTARLLLLHDVAEGGLSFLYQADRLHLSLGTHLTGTLHLPGKIQVPALLEVVHIREANGPLPQQIAGCRFAGLSPWGRAMVQQVLAQLYRG